MTFETEAREERAFYDSLSISEIHALMHERKFGRTGMLWQSLRERGTLVQSAWAAAGIAGAPQRRPRFTPAGRRRAAATCLTRMSGRQKRCQMRETPTLKSACANYATP